MCVYVCACEWLIKCLDMQSKVDLYCCDPRRRPHIEWPSEQPICFPQGYLWLGHCQLQLIIGYTTYLFGFWIIWIHPYSAMWTINFQGQREQPQNNYHLFIGPIFILCQPPLYSSTVLGWGNTDEWGLAIILKEFIVLMYSQICKQIITSCFKTLILQGTLKVLKDHREETDYQST